MAAALRATCSASGSTAEARPGRGDVRLRYGNCFTMELSVRGGVPKWSGQEVTMSLDQDVAFTAEGCRPLDGRQTELYLI